MYAPTERKNKEKTLYNLRSLDIAWNNASRKIFNGFWRERVKPLLFYYYILSKFK